MQLSVCQNKNCNTNFTAKVQWSGNFIPLTIREEIEEKVAKIGKPEDLLDIFVGHQQLVNPKNFNVGIRECRDAFFRNNKEIEHPAINCDTFRENIVTYYKDGKADQVEDKIKFKTYGKFFPGCSTDWSSLKEGIFKCLNSLSLQDRLVPKYRVRIEKQNYNRIPSISHKKPKNEPENKLNRVLNSIDKLKKEDLTTRNPDLIKTDIKWILKDIFDSDDLVLELRTGLLSELNNQIRKDPEKVLNKIEKVVQSSDITSLHSAKQKNKILEDIVYELNPAVVLQDYCLF